MRFELPDGLPPLWQYKSLGGVCSRITSGGTPSRREEKYYGGDISWVKTQELFDRKIFDTDEKISLLGLNNSSAKLLPKDTVLLAMYGATVGKLGVLGKKSTCNQACCAFICDPEITDYRFLFYCLLGNRSNLVGLATGAAQQNLSSQQLKSVEFAFPPLEYQKKMADVLSSLDDRIDHNRALAANLEAIARRLFKSWFVDFDPVRAKAAGEKPPGLADDIAALFPDRLVDSELGEIPEGWVFKPLSSIAEFVNGRNFTKDATGTGRMVIRIAELSNDGPTGSTVWNDLPDTAEQYLVNPGEILFAWSGSLGLHVWDRDTGLVNQHIFKVIPKQPFVAPFVFFAMEELIDDFRAIAAGKAVTMGHIKRCDLDTHGVICPLIPDLLVEFHEIVAPLWNRVRVGRREVLALGAIRDLLLPRLISGKLRVEDAEPIIEVTLA